MLVHYIMVYVAEGTYGCVYRPPIKCKTGKKYTTGKVSKLMTRRAAKKEIEEYKFIKIVDKKKQFYPGPPIDCEVDEIDAAREMAQGECKLFNENPNINDYKLLIYNDGGYDLEKFTKMHLDSYLAPNQQEQTDLFFFNAFNLFEGLRLFLKNDLLHHDIKPQNIVFDPATYRFNYIDFGLAEKKSVLASEIISETTYENFHWSYPLEFGFLNYSKNYYFKRINKRDLTNIKLEFIRLMPSATNISNLYNIKPTSFRTTFGYMENRLGHFDQRIFIESVFDGLNRYNIQSYSRLVRKLLVNTDIYALGFTMNHMINCFYDKGALLEDEYIQYSKLFNEMFHPNVDIRTRFNIDDYATWYSEILKNTGVLTRLGKNIVDGKIVNVAVPVTKTCPDGKELNPATKRCIKVCPPNYYRDATQKCKKNKVIDLESDSDFSINAMILENQLSSKVCREGKELNLVTGRCRNVCKPGTIRNKKGNCVKI
jgi:serine/threonine protein kinase